ncbi:hypothetical protein P4O66_016981, partial [Electrophorus voltai]
MIQVFNRLETGDAFTNVDVFLTALTSQGVSNIIPPVRDLMMNQTFKIISPKFSQFMTSNWTDWLSMKLVPLLPSVTAEIFLNVTSYMNCNNYPIIVNSLNSIGPALSSSTQAAIFNSILQHLTGLNGLSCYVGGSFFVFLKNTFLSSEFPDLSIFLSLIPANRQKELVGSISPEEITEFLNRPNTVKNGSDLCTLLSIYNQTIQYLQTADVDQWFNVNLAHYLPYLSSPLISPAELTSASCLSYKKLVSVLGNNYNFSKTDFTPADMYNSIKAYLTSSSKNCYSYFSLLFYCNIPRCYSSSDPNPNSTAWFTNYIGPFITFLTINDLQSFVPDTQIGVFAANPDNLQLFNTSVIAANVTVYYVTQLYNQNPNFNPLSLPGQLLCAAPGFAFVTLGAKDSESILNTINSLCRPINPEVTAVILANIPTLTSTIIQSLGNESISLTEGQISSAPSAVINSSLATLSTVTGWNQGQANAIVQSITNAGFKISSGAALETLGTLIGGVSTATMSSIPSSQLLTVSQNPTFVNNILTAPEVLQETFVQKLVSLDPVKAVVNVPDALATYIPAMTLTSVNFVNVSIIYNKLWNQNQVTEHTHSAWPCPTRVSHLFLVSLPVSILQGITSTSLRNYPVLKARQVVKACRPRPGRSKVPLQESQLTSMYSYVKDDTSMTFSDFHPDMLLYYDYGKVQNCTSYFIFLGGADFSIPSSILNRPRILFKNAQTCLGISGFSLNKTRVDILGNMTCTLNSSYIQNSDPLIIEKLKNCGDLTDSQVSGIQTLLFSGNTNYGNPSTWNLQTLKQLGPLPLYLNQDFWNKFSFTEKKIFLPSFMSALRAKNTPITKLQRLFTASKQNFRRRRDTGCTAGYITDTTIADQSFILNYTSTQFDLCLNVTVLINNLAAITQIVVDPSMEMVILNKLNQAYPSGLGDSVVQLLGFTSRVANVSEINSWNITSLDTLASLMNSVNGAWTSDQSNAVIMRYLSVAGNTLGTAELNAISSNLCSLNISVRGNITEDSL